MKSTSMFLVLFSAFLMFAENVSAQVEWGIRDGVAASTFSGKGNLADNSHVIVSNLVGTFLTIPVRQGLAVQPEFNYLKKGRSNEESIPGTSGKTSFIQNYLQLPLQFQYRSQDILPSGKQVFYFNAGPYAAFNLSHEQQMENNDETLIRLSGENKKTDWGLVFGLGLQTPLWQRKMRMDLKYDLGLSSIEGQPENYKTKCLSLTVGIVL